MSTIVRVKRRCTEEPIEAFVLNCKRRKVADASSSSIQDSLSSTVFKFAGTLNKDEDIFPNLDKKVSEETQKLKNILKKPALCINDKLRAEHKEISKQNRFKIVNRFRSQAADSSNSDLDTSVTVLDLENDLRENTGNKLDPDSNNLQEYVYDLYYTQSKEFESEEIEDYVSVRPLDEYLFMGSKDDDLDSECDSEDSNAENNWRNDYPDESDVDSINEDDMVYAMKNIEIGDDLLSSDDEREDFVYSIDDDVTVDVSDVKRFGKKYALFKAKHNKLLENSDLDDDSSE